MPLRASKMNGFILGFQRFVWCPKWTPESNNSLMPMLNTIFPLVETPEFFQGIPRNTGLMFDVVMAFASTRTRKFEAVFPLPVFGKRDTQDSMKKACDNHYFSASAACQIAVPALLSADVV